MSQQDEMKPGEDDVISNDNVDQSAIEQAKQNLLIQPDVSQTEKCEQDQNVGYNSKSLSPEGQNGVSTCDYGDQPLTPMKKTECSPAAEVAEPGQNGLTDDVQDPASDLSDSAKGTKCMEVSLKWDIRIPPFI